MKHLILIAALFAAPALAQVDANPSKITVELGAGSTVTETVRLNSKTRSVGVIRNPTDTLTIIQPPIMSGGIGIDATTVPTFGPGYSEYRIRPTTTQPAASADGAFRAVCPAGVVKQTDPIVYPGQPGRSHFHEEAGNLGFDPFSDPNTVITSGNSTCRGGIANRSMYWVPVVYETGTGKYIGSVGWTTYYKSGKFTQINTTPPTLGQPAINFSHIPTNLRIIAGDPTSQTADTYYAGVKVVSKRWSCQGQANVMYGNAIPDCDVGAHLQLEIFMPQCWDGVNLDSPDHKSHMSYGVPVLNKPVDPAHPNWTHTECPITHPAVLPGISFQIAYPTVTVAHTTSKWRLVSDLNMTNPAGWTAHGDLWVAWNVDPADPTRTIADVFVDNCIKKSLDCHSSLLGDGRELYGPP